MVKVKKYLKIVPLSFDPPAKLLTYIANLSDPGGFYCVCQPCPQRDKVQFQKFLLPCL